MSESPGPPQPDPVLRRLERPVGSWSMEGNLVGSEDINVPYDIGGRRRE